MRRCLHLLLLLLFVSVLASALGGPASPAAARPAPDRPTPAMPRQVAPPVPAPTEGYREIDRWHSTEAPRTAGLFRAPYGVDVGPDGAIYVADLGLGVVHVLEADGTGRALWPRQDDPAAPQMRPRDVAVGDEALYVSDPGAEQIHRLALDGRYLGAWSLPGGPGGLAYDKGELFVTTEQSAAVRVLDVTDGSVLRSWRADDTPMDQPWGIDVTPEGRVYVADLEANQATVFDRDGVFLNFNPALVNGLPTSVIDVAADPSGEVYLVTELHYLRQRNRRNVGGPYDAPGGRGIALGPGQGLVLGTRDDRLGFTGVRYVRDRRTMQPTYDAWGNPFAPLGALERPRRISANPDGHVFVLDSWPRVQDWSPTGQPGAQFDAGALTDIAAGQRGSVYGQDGHRLSYWSRDGSQLWQWQPPSTRPGGTAVPYGWLTTVDALGGQVAVLDTGDQRVNVRDFSGNPIADWTVDDDGRFQSIGDLALGPDRAYLLDRTEGVLEVRALEDGQVLARWTVPGSEVRIDADEDHIYVLLREGWVWKLNPDGTAKALWQAAAHGAASDLSVGADGRIYVTLEEANEIAVFAPDPTVSPPEVPALDDRCALEHDKTIDPPALELGQSVEVTLSVTGECPAADGQSDVMLLIDTSGSMGGDKMAAARTAALEFVGQLDYGRNQVGLITFSSDVDLVQGLTDDPRALIRAIPELGDDAATNMLPALYMADAEFEGPRARPAARKVIVLLTDGRPNAGHQAILSFSRQYREAGREIYTVGLGLDVDRAFLRGVATEESSYFEAPTHYDLRRIYDAIARRVAAASLLSQATVVDTLPENMRYVPRSAVPPAAWDPDARTLTWQLEAVSPAGLQLRFRVVPLEAGEHATNASATIDFVDGVGHPGQRVFPVPRASITEPERYTALLPITYRLACRPARADIVLVLDTSSSMRAPAAPGQPTKLEAAVYAARVFLDQVQLPADRVALVSFNSQATVVSPLSGDHAALAAALETLPRGTGTRIDLGLDAAREALGTRRANAQPVVIALTDGRQSGAPPAAAVDAATRLGETGVVLYTVGLGEDADRTLLETLAGSADRAYFAPDEAALAAIYREIAGAIPCLPR